MCAELPKDCTASQHAWYRTGRSWQSSSWYWRSAATAPATNATVFASSGSNAANQGQSQPRGEPANGRSEERQSATTRRIYGELRNFLLSCSNEKNWILCKSYIYISRWQIQLTHCKIPLFRATSCNMEKNFLLFLSQCI